jgi:hypothetical protein
MMRIVLTAVMALAAVASSVQGAEPASKASVKKSDRAAVASAYGLSGIQTVTDEQAKTVRGKSGSAYTHGNSFVSGMLLDKVTKSYVYGVDTNGAFASLEQGGVVFPADPFHTTISNLALGLEVEGSFFGTLIGQAGGGATAYFR